MAVPAGKHVFISYVRDDAEQVDRLCAALTAADIPFWRDRTSLAPGDHWRDKIRRAIRNDSLVFVACFSSRSVARSKSYMNEELTLAVDEFRSRSPGATWLLPVRLDDTDIPEWELGAGRYLTDINYVDFYGDHAPEAAVRLAWTIAQLIRPLDIAIDVDAVEAAAEVEPAAPEDHQATRRARSPNDPFGNGLGAERVPGHKAVEHDARPADRAINLEIATVDDAVSPSAATTGAPTNTVAREVVGAGEIAATAGDSPTGPMRTQTPKRPARRRPERPSRYRGVVTKMPNTPFEGQCDSEIDRRNRSRVGRIRWGKREIHFEPEDLIQGLVIKVRVGTSVSFEPRALKELGGGAAAFDVRRV